jgi:hypothetical protein
MVEPGIQQKMLSKYHLRVCERLMKYYEESQEKRFFVGALNELSRASIYYINYWIISERKNKGFIVSRRFKDNLKIFRNKNPESPILKILELKRDQKNSPIQFDKSGKLVFLINGKYKILTFERFKEIFTSFSNVKL